jgi:hypothetical protein
MPSRKKAKGQARKATTKAKNDSSVENAKGLEEKKFVALLEQSQIQWPVMVMCAKTKIDVFLYLHAWV